MIFEHMELYNMEGELSPRPRAGRHRRAQPCGAPAAMSHSSPMAAACTSACRPRRSLPRTGIEAEVIDLRTLRPLDDADGDRIRRDGRIAQ